MKRQFFLAASALLIISGFSVSANAQDDKGVWAMKKSAWLLLTPAERAQVHDFAEDYKDYLTVARTAQSSTREVVRRARSAGFAEFTEASQVKPGARLIFPNRDRALILVVVGTEPIEESSHVVGTHHDSPHIDLKGRPIFPAGGFALLKTIYYGGIKKYQWANIPLALMGRIDTTDGRSIDISIGLNPGDPVFVIPDNAPHSDTELRTRTYTNVLEGEELDPVVGSIPGETNSVAEEVSNELATIYKIKEEDLVKCRAGASALGASCRCRHRSRPGRCLWAR